MSYTNPQRTMMCGMCREPVRRAKMTTFKDGRGFVCSSCIILLNKGLHPRQQVIVQHRRPDPITLIDRGTVDLG